MFLIAGTFVLATVTPQASPFTPKDDEFTAQESAERVDSPKKISELPDSIRKELADLIQKNKIKTVEASLEARKRVQRSPETSTQR